jgi:hypothetical protein
MMDPEASCADAAQAESQSPLDAAAADAPTDNSHDEAAQAVKVAEEAEGAARPANGEKTSYESLVYSKRNQPINDHIPVHGPQQHAQQNQLLTPTQQHLPMLALVLLTVSLTWRYYKHTKQQKEWQQSSCRSLEQIRQRSNNSQLSPTPATDDKEETNVQQDNFPTTERKAAAIHTSTFSQTNDATNQINGDNTNPTVNETSSITTTHSNHLSNIRAKQQEQLERNAKSAQKQRHVRQKRKKKTLHSSLDHAAADEAYRRRMNIMAEEAKMILSNRNQRQQQHQGEEQQPLNELEEMERMALLQQQNLDYQESLQRDQMRTRQLAFENEIRLRRERALEEAKQRLTNAGVQSDILSQSDGGGSRGVGDESKIRVRLLFPTGQRVEGALAKHHAMGLVYDLALVVLDRDGSLWSQDEDGGSQDAQMGDIDTAAEMDDDETSDISATSDDNADYNDILEEWKQIFYSFSVASTYPQRTFDNLCDALEDCGLSQSAMLMVVVDSD